MLLGLTRATAAMMRLLRRPLLQTGKLDPMLLGAAREQLEPGAGSASISLTTVIVLIGAWTITPLAAGACRGHTRDA
jgi:hypothetical protein